MKSSDHPKSISGFTLLEILAAISILAIALVAVYKMHTRTLSMVSISEFFTTAPLLAQGKLAELERKPINELTNDSGRFKDELAGYTWRAVIDDVISERLGAVAEDLKKIEIQIAYNDDEFTYTIRTYRFIR